MAGKWWGELHRAAKVRADRATGHKGKLLARVWEKQARGLAHLHGVLSVAAPAEHAWAEAYVTALQEMAPRYGFGFVDGWAKIGRRFWPGDQGGDDLVPVFWSWLVRIGLSGKGMCGAEVVCAGVPPASCRPCSGRAPGQRRGSLRSG